MSIKPLMSHQEFCELIGVSHPLLRRMIKAGAVSEIPGSKRISSAEYYKLVDPQYHKDVKEAMRPPTLFERGR